MADLDFGRISEQMQAIYDRIAPAYRERTGTTSAHHEGRLTSFIDMLPPDGLILDLGCGFGLDLGWFLQQKQSAVGIDLSRGQLHLAREAGIATLAQMEMQHLGLRSGIFAGVWSSASLLHIPKTEAPHVIEEVRRVLVPAGVLGLSVKAGRGEAWEFGAYGQTRRFFARYLGAEIQGLLTKHGFSIVDYNESDFNGDHWLNVTARSTM